MLELGSGAYKLLKTLCRDAYVDVSPCDYLNELLNAGFAEHEVVGWVNGGSDLGSRVRASSAGKKYVDIYQKKSLEKWILFSISTGIGLAGIILNVLR